MGRMCTLACKICLQGQAQVQASESGCKSLSQQAATSLSHRRATSSFPPPPPGPAFIFVVTLYPEKHVAFFSFSDSFQIFRWPIFKTYCHSTRTGDISETRSCLSAECFRRMDREVSHRHRQKPGKSEQI